MDYDDGADIQRCLAEFLRCEDAPVKAQDGDFDKGDRKEVKDK